MAKMAHTETAPDRPGPDDAEGWLSTLVADEDDRPSLWRLGVWGVAAVGALVLGIMALQLPVNAQRTLTAAAEFTSHASQIERAIQDNRLEARRLAAAVETLGSDRDRTFTRLSALEQGLDSVTGSIGRREAEPSPVPSSTSQSAPWLGATTAPVLDAASETFAPAAPVASPEATREQATAAHAEPQADAIPLMPPPVIQAATATATTLDEPAARTDFAVDLGGAQSIDALRALWRGVSGAHKAQFDGLRPLIAVQERKNGLGVQLRLVAGPIKDAASVARLCATLEEAQRACKTAAFEGQRLTLPAAKPAETAPPPRKPKPQKSAQTQPHPEPAHTPPPAPPAPPPERSFSLFGVGGS
ncbi:hypothetical protein X566_20870 [Afipia sp. P52-10]|nr:hypothetical protein X566_20870 [Afipia sp. P52-10]